MLQTLVLCPTTGLAVPSAVQTLICGAAAHGSLEQTSFVSEANSFLKTTMYERVLIIGRFGKKYLT